MIKRLPINFSINDFDNKIILTSTNLCEDPIVCGQKFGMILEEVDLDVLLALIKQKKFYDDR